MVNLFYISIGQDDCPHTYLTGKIKDLTIFIMNTQELEDGYQTTFSLFFAKDVENLQETMRLLKEYPGIRNINVLGVKDQVMSLTYTFPRTSAFSHVKEIGFRLHPIIVKRGVEKWFFVTTNDNVISKTKEHLNDRVTSVYSVKKITTKEFIDGYSKLFSELWRVKLDTTVSQTGIDVIAEALKSGYFDWPRKSSLSELSKSVNVPRTTLTYRLRKMEKTIFEEMQHVESPGD